MIRLSSILPYTHQGMLFKLIQEDFILKDESAKYVTVIDDIPQSTEVILWAEMLKLWNSNSVNKQSPELCPHGSLLKEGLELGDNKYYDIMFYQVVQTKIIPITVRLGWQTQKISIYYNCILCHKKNLICSKSNNSIVNLIEQNQVGRHLLNKVDIEVNQLLQDHPIRNELGFCHVKWETKKRILYERYNIIWYSPTELNPVMCFD